MISQITPAAIGMATTNAGWSSPYNPALTDIFKQWINPRRECESVSILSGKSKIAGGRVKPMTRKAEAD
jgi:hypothetical protein